MKPLVKLTFWYEWLLRITGKSKKVFVVPKVGYNHSLGRKGSLVEVYKNVMTEDETQFWFDLAKRESYYHPSVEREASKFEYKKESSEE